MPANNYFPIGANHFFTPVRNYLNTNCFSLDQKRTRRGRSCPDPVWSKLQEEVVGKGHTHCPCAFRYPCKHEAKGACTESSYRSKQPRPFEASTRTKHDRPSQTLKLKLELELLENGNSRLISCAKISPLPAFRVPLFGAFSCASPSPSLCVRGSAVSTIVLPRSSGAGIMYNDVASSWPTRLQDLRCCWHRAFNFSL